MNAINAATLRWYSLVLALLLCAFAAAYIVSSAAPTPAQAGGDYFERCGSQSHEGAGWYHVRAHNVSCRVARHVARYFWNSGGDTHFEGWTCDSEQIGDEVWRAKCTRYRRGRLQVVRFQYGA
jgi:hypothetical protein